MTDAEIVYGWTSIAVILGCSPRHARDVVTSRGLVSTRRQSDNAVGVRRLDLDVLLAGSKVAEGIAPEEGSQVLAVEPDTHRLGGQIPEVAESQTTAELRDRVARLEEMLKHTLAVLEVAISGENQRADGAADAIYALAHRLGNVESAVFRR
jgi:hypothetical protein